MVAGSAVPPSSATVSEPPTGRAYVRLVVILGALIALGPLSIDMYLPAFPSIADDLLASESQVQLTLTGMLAGLALGQLVIGPVSDAYGRRRPLLIGLVVHAIASVLCVVAPDIATLSVARVLQGLAGAALTVTVMAGVRDRFVGVGAATILSRLMLVMGAAPVLAPTLGGVVLETTSWRGVFVVLGVAAVVLVGVAVLFLDESLPETHRRPLRLGSTLKTYGELLRDVPFVALVLSGGLVFSAMFAYIAGSSFVLQDVYGLDERAYALVFGAIAVGIIGFTQLNPLLLRRWSPLQVVTASVAGGTVVGMGLVFVAATGIGGLPALVIALWLLIASIGLAMPNTPSLALSRHGEAAGSASAVLGSVQFGVGAIVSPLVGLLGSGSAVPMAVVMAAAMALALVLLVAVVGPRTEDERPVRANVVA